MECPKCHYVRKCTDAAPDYECPKCGIIYAKFDSAVAERDAALRAKMAARQAVKQPVPLVEAKEPPVVKEPPVKEPPIEVPVRKVTNCPTCGGLVAFGIKACPHCGKTKPAPEPKKPASKVAWILAGLVGLIMLRTIVQGDGGGGGGGIAASRALLVSVLKDPSSVMWRNEIKGSDGATLCGEFNSKNAMGGYVGFTRFIANSSGFLVEGGKFNTWAMSSNRIPVPDYMVKSGEMLDGGNKILVPQDTFNWFWQSNCH